MLDKLELFHADLDVEKRIAQNHGDTMPVVEAPRDVIEYLNRGDLKGFDANGFFFYRDVRVCETGKKDEILNKLVMEHKYDRDQLRRFSEQGRY